MKKVGAKMRKRIKLKGRKYYYCCSLGIWVRFRKNIPRNGMKGILIQKLQDKDF